MPYIDVIQYKDAEGELLEIYNDLVRKRGKLAEVHKIQSLNPPTIIAHMELYMKVMFGKSPLRRYQREMIAVIVSVNNDCNYCIRHHEEALLHFWKDSTKTKKLIKDYSVLELSDKDVLLCQFAELLTKEPNFEAKTTLIEEMKTAGLIDRAILDATLVIGYFNFVNRIVLGLGVNLESDQGTGYNYD